MLVNKVTQPLLMDIILTHGKKKLVYNPLIFETSNIKILFSNY